VTDAEFNLGGAVAAVQALPPGVYIAMNGRIFNPDRCRKMSPAIALRKLRERNSDAVGNARACQVDRENQMTN
jgi:L-asparaginase/Glu-tRNA(Gln) amidotransferase subunit D